jgi:Homeodomain-like domain-containing protein
LSGKPVPWETFLFYGNAGDQKFPAEWVLTPSNVTSTFRGGDQYCRLCDSYFTGTPAEHVESHRPSLEEFLAERRTGSEARRAETLRRRERIEKARALHADGVSVREIADTLGVSHTQVRRDLADDTGGV